MLSNRQQVARLRHLAVRALGAYPLADPELRLIAHGENTTFRVDATTHDGRRDRFLLRVHRPARHGRHVDSAAAIRSELAWLTALRADTDLSVPEPVRTIDGNLTTTAVSIAPRPGRCTFAASEASWHGCTITLASGASRPASCGSGGTGRRSSATRWSTGESTRRVPAPRRRTTTQSA